MTKVIGQHILAQAPTGSSAPDSITIGGGSVWVEYGNGADSTGKSGDTTIVEYSMLGQVEHTYTLTGLADGLKYDPVTGNVWALLNNDANATLRFINPTTGQVSGTLKYGSGYVYGPTSSRGFDDVVFDGSRVFMSETNPANPGDPVIVQLLNGEAPVGTLETQGILSLGDTGTNLVTGQTNQTLPMTDPDSLKLLPNGELLLTGEADGAYIFVKDPGTTQQTESFVQMPAGFVGDDAIMPNATAGTFYISNQGGNDIIRVSVTGLNTNDLYADIASKNELVQIDPTTGKITPIVTGLSNPHGLAFVAAAAPPVTAPVTKPVTPVTTSHPASTSSTPSTPTPIVEGQHILAQAPTGSSAPDSITIGGGSIWVEYGNGADSTGKSGDTTIVEYSMLGQVEHTYTLTGLADGLKYDPITGNVWALLNNDGNATLRFINPTTGEVSGTLKYGSGYVYGPTSSRGFDDVVFDGSRVFMSETNPANPGDPVIVQLLNGEAPVGTLETQGILSLGDTGTNLVSGQTNQTLPMTDPDSLKLLPNGELLLTGEADGAYIFVKDPGTTQQTESFVQMPAGFVGDDAIMPNATAGTFYISNQGGNDIVRVSVTGLNTNDLYANIASKNELVQIDPTTGKITPIVTGLSNPHGLAFVAAAAPTVTAPVTKPVTIPVTTSHPTSPSATPSTPTPIVEGQHVLAQAPTGSSAPDSITIGGGSIWVEYGNGADSTGKSGDTTIVEYSMLGQVEHTYTLTGLADGLKYDPVTGNVWALLNNDANATLRFINPTTGEVSGTLKYGSGYVYGPTSSRGFDDVVFDGSRVFMSETNPANPGDPVIVQLLNGEAPVGTLETQGILSLGDTGTNLVTGQTNQTLPMTDPDSLKLLPNGELLLTGEADGAYIFVKDPGTTQQTESFVQMPVGFVGDDAIMPSATAGTFYISNQGGNDIIRVSVTGLNTNDLYADIASKNELVQIDPTTGKITPIVTGLSNPHGLAFVAAAAPPVTAPVTKPVTPVTTSHPASPSSTPSTPTPIVEGQHILAQAPTGSSAPDSITIGGGSIWVEYGNGADSTGKSGDTTIVEYSMLGQVEHTYTLTGLADGLKYDPVTGNVWALLNNDGNATLRFINPATGEVSGTLKYGSGYVYGPTSSRGFDDVVFDGSRVFMSETNPANPGDPVIVQLLNGEAPVGTLETQGILSLGDTGTNLVTGQTNQTLPMTDPDSLKLLPNGELLLTGEADGAYIFVKDPGTTQQTESFVQMPAGFVGDDAIMPNATAGTFYISNQGGNDIIRVSVTGLNTNDLYADIASKNELVQIDPTTGKITPIVTGLSNPHGLAFVAAAASSTPAALANFVPSSSQSLLSTPAQGTHSADTASIHSATGVFGSAGAFDPMPSTVTSSAHHVDTLHHA